MSMFIDKKGDYSQFFKSDLLHDITLIYNKQEIKAHKFILSWRSQFFRNYFRFIYENDNSSVNGDVYEITYDIDSLFEVLLEHIYNTEKPLNIKEMNKNKVVSLFSLATFYQVPHLISIIKKEIKVNEAEFLDFLNLAYERKDSYFLDMLLNIIAEDVMNFFCLITSKNLDIVSYIRLIIKIFSSERSLMYIDLTIDKFKKYLDGDKLDVEEIQACIKEMDVSSLEKNTDFQKFKDEFIKLYHSDG